MSSAHAMRKGMQKTRAMASTRIVSAMTRDGIRSVVTPNPVRKVIKPETAATLTTINRYLFDELGFAGNNQQYDDPRNSYLNEVMDRKLGIPITLAVLSIGSISTQASNPVNSFKELLDTSRASNRNGACASAKVVQKKPI